MAADIRCFFALWPEPELARRLYAQGDSVPGRRMRQETLHLTLAFLGNVAEERIPELLCMAGRLPLASTDLHLDQLGYWPHKHLCWLGPTGLPESFQVFVQTLHARLRGLGFALEERQFAAHVSLLRNVREVLPPQRLSPPLVWPVRNWRLVASVPEGNGRRYEPLGEWPADAGLRA